MTLGEYVVVMPLIQILTSIILAFTIYPLLSDFIAYVA